MMVTASVWAAPAAAGFRAGLPTGEAGMEAETSVVGSGARAWCTAEWGHVSGRSHRHSGDGCSGSGCAELLSEFMQATRPATQEERRKSESSSYLLVPVHGRITVVADRPGLVVVREIGARVARALPRP